MIAYVIKVLAFIPIVIALIVISLKLSQKTMMQGQFNKYMRVLESININKNNSLIVVKIGDEGCVLSSSSSGVNKIKDLTKEEILQVEKNITDYNVKSQESFNKYKDKIIRIIKKED